MANIFSTISKGLYITTAISIGSMAITAFPEFAHLTGISQESRKDIFDLFTISSTSLAIGAFVFGMIDEELKRRQKK